MDLAGDEVQYAHRSRRRLIDAVLLAVAIILIVVFARHVDWVATLRALRQADVRLLALAVLVDLASIVVKGVRWGVLLEGVGAHGTAPAIRDTIVGAALNNLLVANGGDAARVAISARRSSASSADVVGTLAVERFTDVAVYVGLCGGLALVVALPQPFARWSSVAVVALGITAALCTLLISRQAPAARSASTRDQPEQGVGVSRYRRGAVRALTDAAVDYVRRLAVATARVAAGHRLGIALVLSMLVWAGQWATFHLVAHAAALPISAAVSLLALLAVNASFAIRLTPGNIGVFQLLYVLAAAAAGLDRGRALAVGVLIQLVQYIPVTFLGLALAPAFARSSWRRTPGSIRTSDGASTRT